MKIALVCSHGGHLSEMLELAEAYKGHQIFYISYIAERTKALDEPKYLLRNIGFNPLLMALAFVQVLFILLRERPQLIVSSGSEIALPAFYLARLLGIKTIFIEIWAQVHTPTLTGRLVYPVSDAFFVQWPELLDAYGPRARFACGRI
jgi:beta-1,4-N-acetylglucosaminyltransferase